MQGIGEQTENVSTSKNFVACKWNQDAQVRVELYFLRTIIHCGSQKPKR
jgi:hypothetical protein